MSVSREKIGEVVDMRIQILGKENFSKDTTNGDGSKAKVQRRPSHKKMKSIDFRGSYPELPLLDPTKYIRDEVKLNFFSHFKENLGATITSFRRNESS